MSPLLSIAIVLLGLAASKTAHAAIAGRVSANYSTELSNATGERSTVARNSNIQCPVGYLLSTSEDTCHYFSPSLVCINSWFQARTACQAVGGRLASIETAEEDTYLKDTLKRVYTTTENYSSWIGGTCLRSVNQFRWEHNDSLVKYFGWYSGQPNNNGGIEHCIAMRRDYGYAWDDVNCASFACRYICEYP